MTPYEKFKSTINLNANSIQIQNKKPNLNECLSYGSIVNYLDMLSAFSVRLCIQAPKLWTFFRAVSFAVTSIDTSPSLSPSA